MSRIRERLPGTKIVVLTLPGLFAEGIEPDRAALSRAFPTAFSPNLYAWSVLTEAYNRKLAEFSALRGLELIALSRWSRASFQPRSAYFENSVHLTAEGYDRVGKFLSAEFIRRGYLCEKIRTAEQRDAAAEKDSCGPGSIIGPSPERSGRGLGILDLARSTYSNAWD